MKKIIAVAAALVLALTATISLAGIVVSTKGTAPASVQAMSGEDILGGSGEGGIDLGGITDMLGGFDIGSLLGGLGGDFDIGSIIDTVSGLIGGSSSSDDNNPTQPTEAPTQSTETTTQAPETTTQAPDTTAPSNVNTGD